VISFYVLQYLIVITDGFPILQKELRQL